MLIFNGTLHSAARPRSTSTTAASWHCRTTSWWSPWTTGSVPRRGDIFCFYTLYSGSERNFLCLNCLNVNFTSQTLQRYGEYCLTFEQNRKTVSVYLISEQYDLFFKELQMITRNPLRNQNLNPQLVSVSYRNQVLQNKKSFNISLTSLTNQKSK